MPPTAATIRKDHRQWPTSCAPPSTQELQHQEGEPPAASPILQLTLHGGTDLASLVEHLKHLSEIQSSSNNKKDIPEIHLIVNPTFRMRFLIQERGTELMKCLGQLSKRFVIRGSFRAPFPVQALTALIEGATGLISFTLFQMIALGGPTDFEQLALAVAQHTESLETFDMDMIHLLPQRRQDDDAAISTPGRSVVVAAPLDPLLKTMLKTKTLKVLLLGGCHASSLKGCATFSLLEKLFRSGTIQRLSLINFPISFEQMCRLSEVLQTNNCLRNLCLSCESLLLTAKPVAAAAAAVSAIGEDSNSGSDDELKTDDPQGSRTGSSALKSMLRLNKTLEKLILYIPNLDQDEEFTIELIRAAGDSVTIKGLYLGTLQNMSPRITEALLQMLRTNYALVELGFVCANHGQISSHYPCSAEIVQEIHMLVKLNKKAARGELLQNDKSTPELWVDSLANVSDDVSCVFHLLSLNPALLDPKLSNHGSRRAKPTKKRTTKRARGAGCSSTNGSGEHHASKRKRLYRASKYAGAWYR